jgi:typhasterol/6-deoxotyphasterol 2alpha-hydroxylase
MVTLNVISRMLLGKKYVGEDGAGPGAAATPEEFRWMIEEIFLNGALHVGDMVSWLGWLDAHGYVGRMKRLAAKFDRFIEHVLREHGERQQREGGAFVPGDMVDLLLYLCNNYIFCRHYCTHAARRQSPKSIGGSQFVFCGIARARS